MHAAKRNGGGRALTKACIECAKRAEYAQLELEVVLMRLELGGQSAM